MFPPLCRWQSISALPGSILAPHDASRLCARVIPVTLESAIVSNVVTVATYNIHLGIGSDGRFEPPRIAAVIKELKADIVALQEVGMGAPGFNMLAYLREACGMHAIAGPTLVTAHGDYGNAILSRFHPVTIRRVDLSVPRREPRGALDVEFDCEGRLMRLIATHFGLRPSERRAQTRQLLLDAQRAGPLPLVVLGDLNEWFLWGRPLRWLRRHFKRTPAPATFPARRPLFALDRIWVNPFEALHKVVVHNSARTRVASDHLPLTAAVDLSVAGAVPSLVVEDDDMKEPA